MSRVGKNKRKPRGYQKPKQAVEHTAFFPYIQRWHEYWLMMGYSKETWRRHDSNIRRFVVWCEERGVNDPRDVTKPVIERYQKHLFYRRKQNGEPLSINAQSSIMAAIKAFFKWLTKQNYLLYNPASEIDLPKRPRSLPRCILSVEEIRDMFNAADVETPEGIRDRAILELLYSTGLRRAEAGSLKVHDIDLKRATLMVRHGKGNRDRLLPLGESALLWLQKYLWDARAELVQIDDQSLFISDYGEAIGGDGIGRLVKRYMKLAGLDKEGGAHLFRHAMATHMLDNGADIRFIQSMLGHANLSSTQIYTRVSVEKLREIHKATHPAKIHHPTD